MSHSHSGGDPVQPINTVQVGEERAHRGRDRDSARSSMQGSRAGTAAEGPWVKTYERGVFLGGVLTFLNWTMLMLSLGSTGWRNFTPVQGVYPAIEVRRTPSLLLLLFFFLAVPPTPPLFFGFFFVPRCGCQWVVVRGRSLSLFTTTRGVAASCCRVLVHL